MGPKSDEVNRTIPDNVELTFNLFQTSTDNTLSSRGGLSKRKNGSEKGIVNIKIDFVNHEKMDDQFKQYMLHTIIQYLKQAYRSAQ